MNESPGVLRRVDWRGVFPWLILFRTFRIAISPTLLALAAVAVLVAPWGWRLAVRGFLTGEQRIAELEMGTLPPRAPNSRLGGETPGAAQAYFPAAPTAIGEAFFDLAEPLRRLFDLRITLSEAAYYTLGFLWTLALWAIPGGVVTRRAIVKLATDMPEGIVQEVRYAGRRYLWYLGAPLYPLLGVVLLAVPISLMGLVFSRWPAALALVAGLFWLFVAIASIGAMWLLGGLLLGWPLMWPAVSAEREGNAFDAFSRSFAYPFAKPLHYFFYVVVAAAYGALCWAVVMIAARMVQEFGFWALSWGSGRDVATEIRDQALAIAQGRSVWLREGASWKVGTTIIGVILALIEAVRTAFNYTLFFAVSAAIYLLLRHDVDEKEMDEVYVEGPYEPSPAAAPLPGSTPAVERPAAVGVPAGEVVSD